MRNILAMLACMLITAASGAQVSRERINFDKGWQFAFGDASSPAKDFGCGTEYFNYLTRLLPFTTRGHIP